MVTHSLAGGSVEGGSGADAAVASPPRAGRGDHSRLEHVGNEARIGPITGHVFKLLLEPDDLVDRAQRKAAHGEIAPPDADHEARGRNP